MQSWTAFEESCSKGINLTTGPALEFLRGLCQNRRDEWQPSKFVAPVEVLRCVCVCVCACACARARACACVCARARVCVRVRMRARVCECVSVWVSVWVGMRVRV